jgi:hypothetical protein
MDTRLPLECVQGNKRHHNRVIVPLIINLLLHRLGIGANFWLAKRCSRIQRDLWKENDVTSRQFIYGFLNIDS